MIAVVWLLLILAAAGIAYMIGAAVTALRTPRMIARMTPAQRQALLDRALTKR